MTFPISVAENWCSVLDMSVFHLCIFQIGRRCHLNFICGVSFLHVLSLECDHPNDELRWRMLRLDLPSFHCLGSAVVRLRIVPNPSRCAVCTHVGVLPFLPNPGGVVALVPQKISLFLRSRYCFIFKGTMLRIYL